MNNSQFFRWSLEVSTQEYKGKMSHLLIAAKNPTYDVVMEDVL